MVQIVKVNLYLVGPDDVVVVGFRVGLLRQQLLLVAVFDAGRTGDARAELQDAAVVALQLVGVAGHVGTRPNEAHLPDEDVNQLCEAVHLAVTQPMAYAGDTRVVGRGDRVAFGLVVHGAELADPERLAILSNALLHEKHGSFRVYFDDDADDKQGQKQEIQAYECHDTVEAPLEEEPYLVFIFHHAAWPPC